MKAFCLLLVYFVLITVCGATDLKCITNDSKGEDCKSKTKMCTPHDIQLQDCKRCMCGASGTRWICTSDVCPSENGIPENAKTFNCTPNEIFEIDCNTCKCDSSGTLAKCTASDCSHNKRQKRQAYNPRLECSLFVLTQSGGWYITTYETFLWHPIPVVAQNHLHIFGYQFNENLKYTGENFYFMLPLKSSNTISIRLLPPNKFASKPSKGFETRNKSTKKVPHSPSTSTELPHESAERVFTFEDLEDPSFRCMPHKSFKLECNTCWCAKNGKAPRDCTRIACSPKTYPSLHESTESSSSADRNTIEPSPATPATSYSSLSERVVTFEELEDLNFECEPLKAFKLECNTCWCAKDGKGPRDCTRIACNPKTYPSLEEIPEETTFNISNKKEAEEISYPESL